MIMAGKRGRQSRGVRVELVAGSRRAKDDGPVDEDIRSALGNWPMEKENRWHKGLYVATGCEKGYRVIDPLRDITEHDVAICSL